MAQPPRLGNHYIRRLAGTPKPCLVCYRPSPVVLISASLPSQDFFYICTSHLTDRHFANRIPTPGSSSTAEAAGENVPGRLPDKVSKEEIDKVTREWKERQKAKEERDKAAAAAKEKEKDKEKEAGKGWLSTVAGAAGSAASAGFSLASSAITSAPPPPDLASNPTAPTPEPALPPGQHEHYQLHKDYFAMRKDSLNKRAALKRAQELDMPAVPSRVPTLPSAPPPR
ncbi:unnamed protein product [Tilletia controversa]|uniref:DUF1742-domain-containing protein n=3 Tax=Tilletia TaxID=13289 RepID=A0A8X7MW77_9BASI|nr:hypothetical protein CF336_g5274 [Tilletia laevis]KAE8202521.1 hypothetical protein CF328_g2171 [Tilletia controversa]KAE8263340.1 hypothetical protein A4X03_0g1751 [Tilletia caries]KAE8200288.1 hypothetical protein CF335_g3988 [Tilletia laevis]KAE8251712.1 hypothetical protein A4X06_0g2563 [Tilletia controversa]